MSRSGRRSNSLQVLLSKKVLKSSLGRKLLCALS
jgi:hypothetical protein